MRVVLSARAGRDIEAVIESLGDPSRAADTFTARIDAAVAHLTHFPETAIRRVELTDENVFFWLVEPFWFVLRKEAEQLLVLAVPHCSQDLRRVLLGRSRSI